MEYASCTILHKDYFNLNQSEPLLPLDSPWKQLIKFEWPKYVCLYVCDVVQYAKYVCLYVCDVVQYAKYVCLYVCDVVQYAKYVS